MYERISCGSSSISASLVKDLGESRGDSWMVATVLPEQFHNTASSFSQGRPEAALMQAVLEDAVDCVRFGLRATDRRKQRLAREAEEWLLSDEADWPFSFLNICTVLGLEPQYIRRGLQRWHQQRPLWMHKSKRRAVRSRHPMPIAA
jgi:hypothetical protein